MASRPPNACSISNSSATCFARASATSAIAINSAPGTSRRKFSAWRFPISPTPNTPILIFRIPVTPLLVAQALACVLSFLFSAHSASQRPLRYILLFTIFSPLLRLSRRAQLAHHPFQIPPTRRHTILRRNIRRSKLHILLNHRPTRIPILNQRPKERRKIDVPFPNYGEHLVLNRLFKSPVPLPRLLQHLGVAILNMHEPQLIPILLRLLHRISVAIHA